MLKERTVPWCSHLGRNPKWLGVPSVNAHNVEWRNRCVAPFMAAGRKQIPRSALLNLCVRLRQWNISLSFKLLEYYYGKEFKMPSGEEATTAFEGLRLGFWKIKMLGFYTSKHQKRQIWSSKDLRKGKHNSEIFFKMEVLMYMCTRG